jgi:hypothetical protein
VKTGMYYQIQQDQRSKIPLAQVSRALQFGAITNMTDVWQEVTEERDVNDKYSQQYNEEEHQWIQTVQKTLGHDEILVITRSASRCYPRRVYEQAYILSGDDSSHLKIDWPYWKY